MADQTEIEAATIKGRLDTYCLMAVHLRAGAEIIQRERDMIVSGITMNCVLSTDPDDAEAVGAIAQMDRWLAKTAGISAAADVIAKGIADDTGADVGAPERLGSCESCSKPITDVDAYNQTADGCFLCIDHAPLLSDVIRQHRKILATEPFDSGPLEYDTREEMKAVVIGMEISLADNGDHLILDQHARVPG
ncbi:hypothetical protein SAMN05444339_10230 [Loktanella atrilutea]|uniref:Uncharacterized protein n=1 Tax=Loktanella atrilutea TaxID=366533 RepID=A0A1M4W988_LOKAT|nr:hypothetical protein [Loktanella atrilutea]SHE77653.1 hypothetical protein SAMN05444339_10230 [Loktanella atrilutea]